jgi:predicted component of type VI protein secretion system
MAMKRIVAALVLTLVPSTLLVAGCEEAKRSEAPDSTTQLQAATPSAPTANPSASTATMPVPVGTPTTPTVADAGRADAAADAGTKAPAKK